MNDPIAEAILATDQSIPQRQWTALIASTGRPATIILPDDATDSEIAEFCGWVPGPVMATYRQEREKPRLGILVPQPGRIVRA